MAYLRNIHRVWLIESNARDQEITIGCFCKWAVPRVYRVPIDLSCIVQCAPSLCADNINLLEYDDRRYR